MSEWTLGHVRGTFLKFRKRSPSSDSLMPKILHTFFTSFRMSFLFPDDVSRCFFRSYCLETFRVALLQAGYQQRNLIFSLPCIFCASKRWTLPESSATFSRPWSARESDKCKKLFSRQRREYHRKNGMITMDNEDASQRRESVEMLQIFLFSFFFGGGGGGRGKLLSTATSMTKTTSTWLISAALPAEAPRLKIALLFF